MGLAVAVRRGQGTGPIFRSARRERPSSVPSVVTDDPNLLLNLILTDAPTVLSSGLCARKRCQMLATLTIALRRD